MDIPSVHHLIEDIEAPFALLAIGLVIGSINIRLTNIDIQSKAFRTRMMLSMALLIFVIMQSALMFQDRAVLEALWEQSPVFYSLVYITGGILVLAGIAALV